MMSCHGSHAPSVACEVISAWLLGVLKMEKVRKIISILLYTPCCLVASPVASGVDGALVSLVGLRA